MAAKKDLKCSYLRNQRSDRRHFNAYCTIYITTYHLDHVARIRIDRGVFIWIRIAICDAIWANCESNVKLIRNFANQQSTKICPQKRLIRMNFAERDE